MNEKKIKFADTDVPELIDVVVEEDSAPDGYYEISDIPSKFKLYPKGTKIYSRPLKILEVKQLSTMTDYNFNSVMNSVLSKTVKGIDIDELIIADKLFIIFWQRANTYKGDGFSVPFTCEKCDAPKASYDFDISNIEMEDINEEYDANNEYALPESGDTIRLSQMRVRDEKLVDKFIQQNRTEKLDEDLLNIASLIITINNDANFTLSEKYKYLTEELTTTDNLAVGRQYRKYEISIKPMLKVECKLCGGAVETPISFRTNFFLPEYTA